jgi:membrane-bound serine protease (ClpP class)
MEVVITLLVVGALLLLAETVLPGMIAGIAGFGCLFAGVVVSYQEFGPGTGHLVLLGTLLSVLVGTVLWFRYFPHSRAGQLFVSQGVSGDSGAAQPELVGQTGVTQTALHPCGIALINGRRVDVVSEGAMIERGKQVKVIAVEGLRVVVRAV